MAPAQEHAPTLQCWVGWALLSPLVCSCLPDLHSSVDPSLPPSPPSAGRLTDKALAPLIQGKLPRLRQLYITDQTNVRYNKVEQLLKKRRTLQLQAGETDSDSAAWGCVLAAQGRGYGDGLYGRW